MANSLLTDYFNSKTTSTSTATTSASVKTGNSLLANYFNSKNTTTTLSESTSESTNNGGILGGIGYTFEKIGLGVLQSIEGIWDYTASGIAKLFGADDWAEEQVANDWVNYNHADEWYNPSSAMSVVGDVASGIGTSLPAIAAVAAATVISGGTLTPAAATLVSSSIAGLSAAGTSLKEAYQTTGELGLKEYGYATASGVVEGVIEGAEDILGFGSGTVIDNIATTFSKRTAGVLAKNSIGTTLAKSFVGEALEEGISEIISPYLKRMTIDPDAENATLSEVGYAALIGGLSGMAMGGFSSGVTATTNIVRGNSIINKGSTDSVLQTAANISARETTEATGYESAETVSALYNELKTSMDKTGGQITTIKQKQLLGQLERANTAFAFEPMVTSSAQQIYANAETVAEKMNGYYKDADGNPITVTAAELTAGIDATNDKTLRKTLTQALKTNSKLRGLAIVDATGRLTMDTKAFADATLRGEALFNQSDLNRFVETASDQELNAVGERLGIEDWNALTEDELKGKIIQFAQDGGIDSYKTENATVKQLITQAEATTEAKKNLPRRVNLQEDGVYRYTTEAGIDIAITKQGDSYRVYDYTDKRMSKSLTKQELNKVLQTIHAEQEVRIQEQTAYLERQQQAQQQAKEQAEAQQKAQAEAQEQARQQENERQKQARELDEYARKNVKGYNKLSAANQSMIRSVLRQGRLAGIEESRLISIANVSAHSGLNILFSKEKSFVAANGTYADGAVDLRNNRIIINPEAKTRTHEMILIHELTHVIYNLKDGTLQVAEGLKAMSAEEKENIRKRYSKVGQTSSIIIADEINAHFAEQTLSNKNILERLVADKPTVKERILNFFKGAKSDYEGDAKLSKAAEKLYKQYKKLFDDFSASNYQNNAVGTTRALKVDESGKVTFMDEKGQTAQTEAEDSTRYAFAGENSKTADMSMLEKAKEMTKTVSDMEKIRKETGWFIGYDGKWRYEIDDSKLTLVEPITFEAHTTQDSDSYKTAKLGDIIQHDELFAAYPFLKDTTIIIQKTAAQTLGTAFAKDNQIVMSDVLFERKSKAYEEFLATKQTEIDQIEATDEYKEYWRFVEDKTLQEVLTPEEWLEQEKAAEEKFFNSELGKRYYKLMWGTKYSGVKDEFGWTERAKSVLTHEVQHLIQHEEGFASGASDSYWYNRKLKQYKNAALTEKGKLYELLESLTKEDKDFKNAIYEMEETFTKFYTSQSARNKAYDNAAHYAKTDEQSDILWDYADAYDHLIDFYNDGKREAGRMYENTAGEIEARDAENRATLTAEERRQTTPDYTRNPKSVYFTEKSDTQLDQESRKPYNKKKKNVKKKTPYSQYHTEAMRWAYTRGRQNGDLKVLHDDYDNINLLIADDSYDEGYGILKSVKDIPENQELIQSLYDEEAKNEDNRTEQRKGDVVYKDIEGYENTSGNNDGNYSLSTERTADGRIGEVYQEQYQRNRNRTTQENSGTNRTVDTTRYALPTTDSDGRTLTEEQQDYFKDSKVRDKDGKLLTVYHGSKAKFTEFSHDFISKNGSVFGQGFYFTDAKGMAESYTNSKGQLLKGYLNITKPLSSSEITLSREELRSLIKELDPTGDNILTGYDTQNGKDYPSKTWYNRALNDTVDSVLSNSKNDIEIIDELAITGGIVKDTLTTVRSLFGYDGYIISNDNSSIFVAFESNQFKNATNTAPTADSDIRFALQIGDSTVGTKGDYQFDTESDKMIADLKAQNDIENFLPKGLSKEFVNAIRRSRFTYPRLYRGMEAAELEFIKDNGYIKSKGEYNFANQQNQTLFSYDARYAFSYATGFAPQKIADKFFRQGKPAYLVEIANDADLNFEYNSAGESFTRKEIDVGYITRIFELRYNESDKKVYAKDIKIDGMNIGDFSHFTIHGKPLFYQDKTTGTILYAVQDADGYENGKYISEADPTFTIDYSKLNDPIYNSDILLKMLKISGNESDLVEYNYPDSNSNVRYALPETDNRYTYAELTAKPDMKLTVLQDNAVPKLENGKINKALVKAKALANVRKQNNPLNTDEFVYAHNNDADTDIRVTASKLKHGLDRRIEINAKATVIIGDLIKNAIKVNEVNSLKAGHTNDYVLLSAFSDGNNTYAVSIYVDRVTNEINGFDSVDILYSVNGKEIGTAAPNAADSRNNLPSTTVPTISIAELLEKSNTKFKDIFSKDVYAHFGTEKDTNTKLGSTTRYALSEETNSDGTLLTEEQSKYFKKSKARDEQGNLLVLYNGGFYGTVYSGRNNSYNRNSIYLTDNPFVASAYAGRTSAREVNAHSVSFGDTTIDETVKELYANIENPIILDAQGHSYTNIPIPEDVPQSLKDYFYDTADTDNLPVYAEKYGYDGVIIRNVKEGVGGGAMTEVIALKANQVKLTSNENPTIDDDIRFALPEDTDDTKKPKYTLSAGQIKKTLADYTQERSYTKAQAESIINSVLSSDLFEFGDRYGDMSKKSRAQAIDTLWQSLNTAKTQAELEQVLTDTADYIIQNMALESIYNDEANQAYVDTIDALKPYQHGLNLGSLRGEIKSKYGAKNTVYALWSAGKNKGIGVDVLQQELAAKGFTVEGDTTAEILFNIVDGYNNALQHLQKQDQEMLSTAMTSEQLEKLQFDISVSLLRAIGKTGNQTTYAKLTNKSDIKALSDLAQKLFEQNTQTRKQIDSLKAEIKELEKKATQLRNEAADAKDRNNSLRETLRLRDARAVEAQKKALEAQLEEQQAKLQAALEKQEKAFKKRLQSVTDKYKSEAARWKNKYQESKAYNSEVNKVLYKTKKLKGVVVGERLSATQFKGTNFKSTIGQLARIEYRGDFNTSGTRRVFSSLAAWYTPDNPILMTNSEDGSSAYYNAEVAAMLKAVAGNEKPLTQAQSDKIAALMEQSGAKTYKELQAWYTIKNLKSKYNAETKDLIKELASPTTYTVAELQQINNIVSYFTHFIETYNRIYRNGALVDALPVAQENIRIINDNKNVKLPLASRLVNAVFNHQKDANGKGLGSYMDTFADPMTVARNHDQYQNGFYTQTLTEFREAMVGTTITEMQMRANIEEFYDEHKQWYKELQKRTVEYNGAKLSAMQAMTMYLTLKRRQAQAGLAVSGFKFINQDGTTTRINGFAPGLDLYSITPDELNDLAITEQQKLYNSLTETDREYLKLVEDMFNNQDNEYSSKSLKYKTDMKLNGYSNVLEDYYFPIYRAFIGKTIDSSLYQGEIDRVSNLGFNKNTVTGAKGELYIEPITSIIDTHIKGIAMYANMATAIRDYDILFNLDIGGNPNKTVSLRTETENDWRNADRYFKTLLSDMQGISPVKGGTGIMGKMRSNYAKSVLGLNPKVWVTQLSSIFASTSRLDYASIMKASTLIASQTSDVDEYCLLAKARNTENTAALAQGVIETTGKIGDVLMKPIGAMDRFVVKWVYAAAQVQVEKEQSLKVGTKENKVAAGKLTQELILETQQNAMATERSAAMRSGSELLKSLTMFSSDAMKVIGRVIDAFGEHSVLKARLKTTTDATVKAQLEARLKEVNKSLRKSLGALVASSIFMALVAQAFRSLYNKDKDIEDDEDYGLQVLKNMSLDAVGNLMGGLPILKDLYSYLVDGYDIEDYSYSTINDLLSSVGDLVDLAEDLFSGSLTSRDVASNIKTVLFNLGKVVGLPVRQTYNLFYGLTSRISESTAYKIDDAFKQQSYVSDLTTAIEKEDMTLAGTIMELLLEDRTDADLSDTAMSKLLELYQAGYTSILPKSISTSITYNGETLTLTSSQLKAFENTYYAVNDVLETMIGSTTFNSLSEEQQAKAVQLLYNAYYYKALSELVEEDSNTTVGTLSNYMDADKAAMAYAVVATATSEKDSDGNTISGSKKASIISALQKQGLSDGEILFILCYSAGYAIQDGDYKNYTAKRTKRLLLNYILKLNVTQAEKAAIAAECGFTVKNNRIITSDL